MRESGGAGENWCLTLRTKSSNIELRLTNAQNFTKWLAARIRTCFSLGAFGYLTAVNGHPIKSLPAAKSI
jgi:hypothetical protein